jgi:hypothetical protein
MILIDSLTTNVAYVISIVLSIIQARDYVLSISGGNQCYDFVSISAEIIGKNVGKLDSKLCK